LITIKLEEEKLKESVLLRRGERETSEMSLIIDIDDVKVE
jgi:hypothetical protein